MTGIYANSATIYAVDCRIIYPDNTICSDVYASILCFNCIVSGPVFVYFSADVKFTNCTIQGSVAGYVDSYRVPLIRCRCLGRCVGRSGRLNRCVCGYPGFRRSRRVGCRRTSGCRRAVVPNSVQRRLNVQTVSRTASWHDPPRQSGQRMNQKHHRSRRCVCSGFFRLGVRYRDVRVRMFQSTRPVTFPGPISIAARPPVNSILRVFQVCLLADGSLPWAMSHSAGTSIRNRLTIRSNGTGGSRPNPGVPPA